MFFIPENDSMRMAIDVVDEGIFKEGKWVSERRLYGDEVHASTYDGTGLVFPNQRVSIQRISLYHYQ